MKKIILIILFVATFQSSNAQNFGVPDTLAYLQSIVTTKTHFIGQPFSKLMDSLKLQIKYFSSTSGLVYDISKETSTHFGFHFVMAGSPKREPVM